MQHVRGVLVSHKQNPIPISGSGIINSTLHTEICTAKTQCSQPTHVQNLWHTEAAV